MLVSLNGVTQAPETAFTVSGSNITFSSALTSSDVIDYILVLGDVLSVGTPSDGTVGTSQMSYPLDNFSSTGIDDNATSTAITITSTGKVGIGETIPSTPLHIKSTSGDQLTLEADSTTIGPNLVFANTDGNLARIASAETNTLRFEVGPSNDEAMRINSSGNVGIGTDSPDRTLHVHRGSAGSISSNSYSVLTLENDTICVLQTLVPNTSSAQLRFGDNDDNGKGIISYDHSTDHLQFNVNGPEKMRIDSSGNLLVGTTSLGGNSGRFQAVRSTSGAIGYFEIDNGGGAQNAVDITNAANAAFVPLRFWVNGYGSSLVGSISCTTSATTYNTSSDQRLKENIVDASSASDDIDAIQVRSFDWKADGSHQKYGMVAQELVTVAPEAVTQPEDSEEMMGVDYSKLVPMMIKEIQDLRARVAQLEGA
jgi:hypothetical protein